MTRSPQPSGLAGYTGTIPRLLAAAAERDPGGVWLRTDETTLTFAAAADRVAGADAGP